MRVWVIQPGEPVPLWEEGHRPWRTGLLCQELASRGHDVTWWTSGFSHMERVVWPGPEQIVDPERGYSVRFIRAPAYHRNVSIARQWNHLVLARRMHRRFNDPHITRPHVILSSFPPIETTVAAARYARRSKVPLVVDVRDLHPDVFATRAPKGFRSLVRAGSRVMAIANRYAFRCASAVTAVAPSYERWALTHGGKLDPGPWDRVVPFGYPATLETDETRLRVARDRLVKAGAVGHPRTVWFVGTLGESCDIETVIAAARVLEAEGSRDAFRFVISGTGRHETDLRRAATGIESVRFTGWLDSAGLAVMRQAAWVGLMAYQSDAMMALPNKLAEYLSAGIPVIHSLGGDTQQVVEELGIGLHYEAGSSPHLVEGLQTLSRQPALWDRLAANAQASFEMRFNSAITSALLADVVEGTAREDGTSP